MKHACLENKGHIFWTESLWLPHFCSSFRFDSRRLFVDKTFNNEC